MVRDWIKGMMREVMDDDIKNMSHDYIERKMVECGIDSKNMNPVAKLSDNPAKTMCEDQGFMDYLTHVIK